MVELKTKWLFFSKVCPKVESQGQIEKKSSVGATGEELFDLIEGMVVTVRSSSFLRRALRLTQTKKFCNGRMKHKF